MVNKKSFTLIELLIVIGILAILMGTVLVAINPFRQFAQTRNSQRWSHLSSILSAVYTNIVDNEGRFVCGAGSLPSTATYMGPGTGEYNICNCLVPTYIAAMPYDPSVGSFTNCGDYASRYQIRQDPDTERITVIAPHAELGENISLTR